MNRGKERGITLIVLIITVIILLILSGVSIGIIVNGDIIGKTKNTVNSANQKIASSKEGGNQAISEYINEDKKQIKGGTEGITNEDEEEEPEPADNEEYEDDGVTVPIPGEFILSGLDSERDVEDGLVIYRKPSNAESIDWTDSATVTTLQKTYDQFVWIPVPDINDMYICQNKGTGSYGTGECNLVIENDKIVCKTHGDCENMAGRLYATILENHFGEARTNVYSTTATLREPDIVRDNDGKSTCRGQLNSILGTSLGNATQVKDYFQAQYNEVAKSVCKYHGFYVGRYETSNFTTDKTKSIKVVLGTSSKLSNINWYYMYAQEINYAKVYNFQTVGSSMIQGTAYDQVMKFIQSKWNVTNTGKVAHNFDTYYKTGSKSADCVNNIFDLEGNCVVMTTEANSQNFRVGRGGSYDVSKSASCRHVADSTLGNIKRASSLCMLYVK